MDIQKVIEGLDALFDAREKDKIEDYLSKNLEQSLTEGDIGSAITIINELIGFYRDSSQYEKAEKYCEKLLPFLDKAGLKDTIHYGTSCLNIANAYRASGRLDDSLAHYKMVFDIYGKNLPDSDMRYASLHNNLSLLYQEMDKFDKACEELNSALEIVKLHPEAKVELGVTYSNLASSYVKLGELSKAEEAVINAGKVFEENGLLEDYHYTATLAGAGDVYLALANEADGDKGSAFDGYCESAIENYEKAMLLLKSHMGLTHAYFRIYSKLVSVYDLLGRTEELKGLNICMTYFEKEGYPVIKKLAKEKGIEDKLNEITFGKVGEGSECSCYDDLLSIDHDFGPGFCIFVTRNQYDEFGKELESAYCSEEMPDSYMGFERPPIINDKPRNGVIVIEDFMKRILNLSEDEAVYLMEHKTLPDEAFLRCQDWQLKTVTNGRIFCAHDNKSPVFEEIYNNLKKGYPEAVRRRKIAQCLGEMSQSGQYNYTRMMLRKDKSSAKLMIDNFVRSALHLLYLLNSEYAPHDKWLFEGTKKLSKGKGIAEKLGRLLELPVEMEVYEKREMTEWIGTANKDDKVLLTVNEVAGDFVKLMKEEGLTNSSELYLESHIGDIL